MKFIHKIVPYLGILMGIWILGSFVGVMLNLSNAEFWTTSLMWALLASLVVMPALVVVYHASTQVPAPPLSQEMRTDEPVEEPAPFVGDEEKDVLWPSPEARQSAEE